MPCSSGSSHHDCTGASGRPAGGATARQGSDGGVGTHCRRLSFSGEARADAAERGEFGDWGLGSPLGGDGDAGCLLVV